MNTKALEQRARRMARKQDKVVVKIREDSRWFFDLGPYMVCDLFTNCVEAQGMSLDHLMDYLSDFPV